MKLISGQDSGDAEVIQYLLIEPEELRSTIKETINETFTTMGVDTTSVREVQKDFLFLTSTRKKLDNVSMWVGRGIVLGLLGFALTLFSLGMGVWTNLN